MEIKTYKTNNPRFPWTAEDDEGHSVEAKTRFAALNTLKTLYHILPKVRDNQRVDIPNEVKL